MVDDFDDVTPELLRSAYVEALYRAAEFDFRRLNMNFWIDVVMNVSKSMSTDVLFEKFPPVDFGTNRVLLLPCMYVCMYVCMYGDIVYV